MAEELEIKLSLSPEQQAAGLCWLLGQPGSSRGPTKALVNRYYDTPGGDLNRQKVALRVRRAGDRFIQTLKTQGEFVDGAHRRQEWEWLVADMALNPALLVDTPLGQGVDLAALSPVFETNFERQIVMLEDESETIEVAVDAGSVMAGGAQRPLNEIEFELKSGHADGLGRRARSLAAQVPVFLNLVSKAEQGYFMAGLHAPADVSEAELSVAGFLRGLSIAWLRGEPLAVNPEALSVIEAAAGARGVSAQFEVVRRGLLSGESVPDLASSAELGQLQLALAASAP